MSLKGGNIYGQNWNQQKVKALISAASGSKVQDTNLSNCVFNREANRSMSGKKKC